jgi:HEAT repeat protein
MGIAGNVFFAGAQELSIEESYLQESVEMMIIREQARSNERDGKLLALEYLRQMIEDGADPKEVQPLLAYMALEGIINKIREDGRVANNYPDIRIKAVEYLGDVKTKESAETLLRVLLVDNEPAVLSSAVRSLGKLGFNDDDYTVNAILYVFTQYDITKPDNVLALSVIDTCYTFSQNRNAKSAAIYGTLLRISSNAAYIKPVRDYAGKTLARLYKKN